MLVRAVGLCLGRLPGACRTPSQKKKPRLTVYRRLPVGSENLDGSFGDLGSVENYVLEIQPFVRALVFFPKLYDMIPARHLDLRSILSV